MADNWDLCPNCNVRGFIHSDYRTGAEVCEECGVVVRRLISDESEYRTFSSDKGDQQPGKDCPLPRGVLPRS